MFPQIVWMSVNTFGLLDILLRPEWMALRLKADPGDPLTRDSIRGTAVFLFGIENLLLYWGGFYNCFLSQ